MKVTTMNDAKGRTQVDNFVLPSALIWVLWVCFLPGLIFNLIFLFTLVGWIPPGDPANFSPAVIALKIRQIPSNLPLGGEP
jgi:hypothetical protein